MKTAPLFKKYIIPCFSDINYHVVHRGRGIIAFSNEEQTTIVILTQTSRCPVALFDDYVEMMEQEGPKLTPRALTIKYGVHATYRSNSIEPQHLHLGTVLDPAFFYYDEDSFKVAAEKLVKQSIEVVCPYLDTVAEQAVFLKDAPYHLLRDRPRERAESFARKYSLPMQGEGKVIQHLIDSVFLSMLPQKLSERKETFFQKLEDIAGLAAYCGEVILQHYPDGYWSDFSPQPFAEDVSRYGIQMTDTLSEDVMWDVIASWNLSPQVEYIGLHDRYFLKYFNSNALWGN